MRAGLQPDIEAAFMAVRRVDQLLKKVTGALNKAGVPYAIVGGHAVAAWVASVDPDAVRFTKDVDLLVRRGDLAAIADVLRRIGLVQTEVLGVTVFVDRKRPTPRGGVHVVVANEKVRPHYVHPAPEVRRVVRGITDFPVVDLPALVTMKLQPFRDIDRAHIRDLKSVGLIDAALARKIPHDLRARLKQILQTPE